MKIEFKKISKVDLTKIFPIINKEDYTLLSGQTLIIPDAEYDKIQKQGSLKIGPYQISKDLIEIAKGEQYDPKQMLIQEEVSKKFIYSEDIVDVLCRAVRLNKNVILYGRGGHGKSEMTEFVLELMKNEGIVSSEPFVMSFGDGLTEESLFGGINIKKFKDTGELEYLFKNSFMEHEVVVFEEIFDAPPQILLSLKDILTSGKCRKGNQTWECKTKVVIGLTNKSKEDFSEDDSLEALVQRFPLTYKTEWDRYEKNDFTKLFKTVYGNEFYEDHKNKLQELAEICAANNTAKESFVSPRTAIHAGEIYADGGDLKFISDIDKKVLADFYKANKDREQDTADSTMFEMIQSYMDNNKLEDNDSTAKLLDIIIGEHKSRTGQDIEIEKDDNKIKTKISKLEFVVELMNIHKWSAKNMENATKKKSELKDYITELKKNNK